jgi:membrane fusion protein, copper/silver efflux system
MNTNKKNKIRLIAALVVGLILGALFFGGPTEKDPQIVTTDKKVETWTCSMHPQIRQPEPGQCPICGMDLIPLESNDLEIDPNAISLSESAMIIAGVSTYIVGNTSGDKEISLNGKIEINEKKSYGQASHIPGRIEKIMVTFTGEYVKKGQVVAYVYSPELSSTQQELLEAYSIKDIQPQLFESVKMKLKNWKVSDATINSIIKSGKTQSSFAITADVSGYIIKKNVELGDYVQRGQTLYEVADLSNVWILFEVYETDIDWVKVGNKIDYTIASFPGETFSGTVNYIDPFINPSTRIATARIEVNNASGKLKPEMFVTGTIKSTHSKNKNTLSIPKTAVMWTGKRSIVYVKSPDDENLSFKLREVTLGPLLGDSYSIVDGLKVGEEIVKNGTFNVDAAAQLAGKPSMMSYEHEEDKNKEVGNVKAVASLKPLFTSYFKMKDALVKDDFTTAKSKAENFKNDLSKIDMKLFEGDSHKVWMSYAKPLNKSVQYIDHAKNIEELRTLFAPISEVMIKMSKSFNPLDQMLYSQYCPMAINDQGAYWLSKDAKVLNPYFGEAMLKCGEVKETINK